MIIRTSVELVRYIRHHIAGSEHQDVTAVEDFVRMRMQTRLNLIAKIIEDEKIDFSKHEQLRKLLDASI
jgi:hypothetical protein